VAVGGGAERWIDLRLGALEGDAAVGGDPLVRDRLGNWTYAICVVVDDMRHGVDVVIRGEDLLDVTPLQLRLAALLGRPSPARFLHHPLVRDAAGRKLSKAEGATSIRSMLDAGRSPAELLGQAAHLGGLRPDPSPVDVSDLGSLFA
jgi:glutamyl/glutaminyl-tRNA synthetase